MPTAPGGGRDSRDVYSHLIAVRRGHVSRRWGCAVAVLLVTAALAASATASPPGFRVGRVVDGDTIRLQDGIRVRLVQIDTPEVYFRPECYGREASRITKTLLPPGTAVRLVVEPATDSVDRYGRWLRYVVRAKDGLDVNVRLVALGAAAPYFYRGRRGRYARELDALARHARALRLGLWGRCPGTPYAPDRLVDTGPAR